MRIPQQKFLRVSEPGVHYLTVGSVETEQGAGWMDQAVLFCPFCGAAAHSVARWACSPKS
jgi:hypothetical protein